MDIFIEQCIDTKNIQNKENEENEENKENIKLQSYQQPYKKKVIFHIGPDKKNSYKLVEFNRWEF